MLYLNSGLMLFVNNMICNGDGQRSQVEEEDGEGQIVFIGTDKFCSRSYSEKSTELGFVMAKAVSKAQLLLYKHDASPPSNAVIILGELLGLKFDYKEPSLVDLEHKTPEFKKINPMGTIPVLQDGDFIVSESHAIMKYLLGQYGDERHERLYPRDVRRRAIVDQRLFYDAAVYFNRLKVIAWPTLVHGLDKPSQAQLDDIEESYSVLEAYLQDNKYIASDHLTIADISLGTTTTAMLAIRKINENRFPRCVEWLALLNSDEIFQKINSPCAALFSKVMHMYWEKNKKK